MPKRQKIILIVVFVLSGITVGAVFCFAAINPPKDSISGLNYPPEYF